MSPVASVVEADIYLAVGRTLTAWERLDTALAMTFGHLVGTQHVVALRAIGRIESPAARLNVILEAFRSAEDEVQKFFRTFENLLKEVMKFTEARNAIAHGQVIGVQLGGGPIGYYLAPGISTTRKVKHLNQIDQAALIEATTHASAVGEIYDFALNAERILSYRDEFERLLAEVTACNFPSAHHVVHHRVPNPRQRA